VLLTTQYLEEADRLAHNIVVVNGGRVIAEGTAAELKASLGNTIVEIRLPDLVTAQQASRPLRRVGPTEVLDDGRTLAVKVADSGRSVLEVVRALDSDGVEPDSLVVREPTLDDVFLHLTGHTVLEPTPDSLAESAEPAAAGGRNRGAA